MELTRRDFNAAALGALAGLGLPSVGLAQASRTEWFEWEELASGVLVAKGQGGNALVLHSEADALLVDCKNIGYADALVREAASRKARPTMVVNTHHHADHTGGNHVFLDAGLPVWAHEAALPRIAAQVDSYRDRLRSAMQRLPRALTEAVRATREDIERHLGEMESWGEADFRPSQSYAGQKVFLVGGQRVELHTATPAHTDNDTFVWLPSLNVLHTGDLVFNGLNPYIDVGAGATTRGWDKALDTMLATTNPLTKVVPGHGPVGGPEVLENQKAYFATLRKAVKEAVAGGADRDAVVALRPEGTASLGRERGLADNLGIVFDELQAE